MQSFSRGWSFLQQAWQMAFKDKDLLKPSIYALIVGMIVSVIGINSDSRRGIPDRRSSVRKYRCGVMGAVLVFVNSLSPISSQA